MEERKLIWKIIGNGKSYSLRLFTALCTDALISERYSVFLIPFYLRIIYSQPVPCA